MLFMVIERFRDRDPIPVYQRVRDAGIKFPEGLSYVGSWIEPNFDRCFQLTECDDARLLQEWVLNCQGLGITFEIVPVVPSKETREVVAPFSGFEIAGLFLFRLIVMRDLREFGRGEIPRIGKPRLRRLAHMRGERGHPFDQRVEILRVERQQPGLAHRRYRAASFGTMQQRDFSEERAVRKPNAPVRQFDLDLARGDEIH
jgi:hypothetical protein